MYDELIKRLREAAKMSAGLSVFFPNGGGDYTAKLYEQAADAIEELSREYESIAASLVKSVELVRKLQSPRWIPVTKRLPERDKYVLVRYKNNDMAVACVFERDENFTFWRAQTDEGWCCDCDTEPTHWMPLPEPPKEGET